jgi:hypothetical protein
VACGDGSRWRRWWRTPVTSRATMDVRIGVVEPRVYMRMGDAGRAAVATSLVLVSASQRDHRACGDVRRMGWMTAIPDVLDRLRRSR